jgi:autonomous glycyl radical cofactor GrcA
MTMTLPNVVQKARQQLGELTGLEVSSTVSARKDESGWCVQVEVVEKKSLPDSQDILAIYELTIDAEGNMLNFDRIGMRRRADVVASIPSESGA